MSTREKLIKARLGMLALAEELQNISWACRRAGISRSHFYEIKEAFEKWGAEGLAPQPRRKPRMPNQTPPELEAKILEMTEQYPTYSYIRISQQLRLIGIGASPSAVRCVWQRHGLVVRYQRLLWLERKTAERGGVLTEAQMRLLRKARGRLADPEQHIEAPHPGHLLCQDTYFVGTIKGVGKIYQQTVIDAHASLAFAKLYPTSYAYNISGELTQITYPSGRVVQQSVDPIGRLCEVAPSTSGCGTAAAPFATGFLYNTAGQTTGFKYGNNIYASFGFSSDRLQLNCLDYSTTNRGGACAHDGTTKFGLNYSYPATPGNNGLISGISDSVDSGRSASYTFDSLYRLATAQTAGSTNYPAWGLSETYDRYGNRTQQAALPNTCVTIACPQPSFAVSASTNRLVGSPYSYDASGNLTNDGINTLVYDAENHLVSATNGGASGTYTYDGNGLRVKKVSGSNNTVYIFSGSKVIAEYDNGAAVGSPSREYIYSGSALLAKIDSSGTKYYHQDHLSNRMVTDASGTKVAEMGHFPYGESWYNATSDKLVFTTYERDSESGNDYAQARYHVSGLGRFSSPDPIAGSTSDPQSFNRYSYVRNMPVMLTDPTGTIPGCTTVRNHAPEASSSDADRTGGPSASDFSADPPPQAGCGGGTPCEYTLAGCAGGFGGPGGAAGLDGGFSGDDSGMAPTFGIGQSPGDLFSSIGMTFYTFTGSANFHWSDYDLGELLDFASQGEISVSSVFVLDVNAITPGGDPGGGPGGSSIGRGRDTARRLLSDKDCAEFLKALLVKAGSAPNLDTFLKNFDSLTIVPTPPGDKNGSTLYTAHVDQIGQNSTVHVDGPNSADLAPTLLHETFHTIYYGITDAGLAQYTTGSHVSPGGGISASRAQFLNSRAASAAFDKNCDPSKVKP